VVIEYHTSLQSQFACPRKSLQPPTTTSFLPTDLYPHPHLTQLPAYAARSPNISGSNSLSWYYALQGTCGRTRSFQPSKFWPSMVDVLLECEHVLEDIDGCDGHHSQRSQWGHWAVGGTNPVLKGPLVRRRQDLGRGSYHGAQQQQQPSRSTSRVYIVLTLPALYSYLIHLRYSLAASSLDAKTIA